MGTARTSELAPTSHKKQRVTNAALTLEVADLRATVSRQSSALQENRDKIAELVSDKRELERRLRLTEQAEDGARRRIEELKAEIQRLNTGAEASSQAYVNALRTVTNGLVERSLPALPSMSELREALSQFRQQFNTEHDDGR